MSHSPKRHLDRFSRAGLTKVTNKHTQTDRQTDTQTDHATPCAAISRYR